MEYKQVIIVSGSVVMSKGKTSSQVAHASLDAYEKTKNADPIIAEKWKEHGQSKIILKINDPKEFLEKFQEVKKEFPAVLIKDAGRTQIPAGTPTAIGIGPVPENEINKYTKDLKLL